MFHVEPRTKAQESTNAIERLYITIRHLFTRGFYKPMGVSGETLREALLTLKPEIYGSIGEEKLELEGLLYVMERLPDGIEECTYINLTSDEGYHGTHFKPIIPPKRRRNCYRIDSEQMNIEITRGRSEIYDILTHLTFLMIESHKIMKKVLIDETGGVTRDWQKLEKAIGEDQLSIEEREIAITYVASMLGRTFQEINNIYEQFATDNQPDKFLHIIYHLGRLALRELLDEEKRVITFSPVLRERLGHHIHGDRWAKRIKETLLKNNLFDREIHVVSANLHSVMNSLYAVKALNAKGDHEERMNLYSTLSKKEQGDLRRQIHDYASQNGMIELLDTSGTIIDVQIFDLAKVDLSSLPFYEYQDIEEHKMPVLIVMDYAFGEQAYETMDELLKPYRMPDSSIRNLNVQSVNIMGKAGILDGDKGDIMIPTAHIFEGTADNYPFKNQLGRKDFRESGIPTTCGAMVTVLGTSLQNKDLLEFFMNSSWDVIGLEMEGAHYQKAIQAASKVRRSIGRKVKLRYAYYASDNPLKTGHTLASGGLGLTGVKPVYVITEKILEQILDKAAEIKKR